MDFAYRAMHEMTVQSKALIKAFYDQSPRLSYYNGCSTGGRQGLMAAQRYPEDFDAILAGAPANDHLYLHAGDMARMIDIFKDPEGLIPQAKQDMLAKAVMSACDALDGVKDNLITNPMACKFDPAVLQCKSGDAADCLTRKQVATAKRLYAPAKNSKGELIFPGYAYGGESAYNIMRGITGLRQRHGHCNKPCARRSAVGNVPLPRTSGSQLGLENVQHQYGSRAGEKDRAASSMRSRPT